MSHGRPFLTRAGQRDGRLHQRARVVGTTGWCRHFFRRVGWREGERPASPRRAAAAGREQGGYRHRACLCRNRDGRVQKWLAV
ncbi:unnamed protein product [Ectocarpus sp. 12 AP-2014]